MILFFWSFAFFAFLASFTYLVFVAFKTSSRQGFWSLFFPPFSLLVAWQKNRLLFLLYVIVVSFFLSATHNLMLFVGTPKSSSEFLTESRDSKVQFDFGFLESVEKKVWRQELEELGQDERWSRRLHSKLQSYTYMLDHPGLVFASSGYLEGSFDEQAVKALAFISVGKPHGYGTLEKRVTRIKYSPGLQTNYLTLEKKDQGYLSYVILELPLQIYLEIFEWNESQERPVTQLLVDEIAEDLELRLTSKP